MLNSYRKISRKRFEEIQPFAEYEVRALKYYWGGVYVGVISQHVKTSAGEYLFPQLFRHHFSNLFDVPALAGFLNFIQMPVTGKSRPIACGMTALFLGAGWETFSAVTTGRGPDWPDIACYVVGTAFFCTRHTRFRIRYQTTQAMRPGTTFVGMDGQDKPPEP